MKLQPLWISMMVSSFPEHRMMYRWVLCAVNIYVVYRPFAWFHTFILHSTSQYTLLLVLWYFDCIMVSLCSFHDVLSVCVFISKFCFQLCYFNAASAYTLLCAIKNFLLTYLLTYSCLWCVRLWPVNSQSNLFMTTALYVFTTVLTRHARSSCKHWLTIFQVTFLMTIYCQLVQSLFTQHGRKMTMTKYCTATRKLSFWQRQLDCRSVLVLVAVECKMSPYWTWCASGCCVGVYCTLPSSYCQRS